MADAVRRMITIGVLALLLHLTPCFAATTVNTTDDSVGDGDLVCSLREAVDNANTDLAVWANCDAGVGDDTILFDIPGAGPHVLDIDGDLPEITDQVWIDGLSQSGASCSGWPRDLRIALRATYPGGTGLKLSFISTVTGLSIGGFDQSSIEIGPGSVVTCSHIGMEIDGSTPAPNGVGILDQGVGFNTRIGGPTDSEGNLILGNNGAGIRVEGSNVQIWGNRIGTDETGVAARPNGAQGGISVSEANNVNIGQFMDLNWGNLISGNAPATPRRFRPVAPWGRLMPSRFRHSQRGV